MAFGKLAASDASAANRALVAPDPDQKTSAADSLHPEDDDPEDDKFVWCVPKGEVEKKESLIDAARRELMEEADLSDIEPTSLVDGSSPPVSLRNIASKTCFFSIPASKYLPGGATEDGWAVRWTGAVPWETRKARWFTMEQLLSKPPPVKLHAIVGECLKLLQFQAGFSISQST